MMRRLYSASIYCAVPFAFAAVLWRGLRDRSYWQGLGERCGLGERFGRADGAGGTACIWLHAVSLGEMSAAAPLVRALRTRHPRIPLLLTTATPTGRARAEALIGEAAAAGDSARESAGDNTGGGMGGGVRRSMGVRFLPYDTPGAVARFLDRIGPRLAIIMETELWPNLYAACERRGVPVVIASARLSEKSVSRYRRFGAGLREIFSATSLIAAQTREDADRFIAIGAESARTHVVGNLKFDLELGAGVAARGRQLRAALGTARPIWIAGSTHAGEEESVLAAHQELPDSALLMLVPRHPARFDAVADWLSTCGVNFVRRSTGIAPDAACRVLLVDTVGELAALYAAADAAFVGGSLVPVGGHNLLEPAALGLPVLTGPYNFNGKDIARILLEQGAALEVKDARELAAVLRRLLADPEERGRIGGIGRRIVESNRGSTQRLLELIEPLLGEAQEGEPPLRESLLVSRC
jgi:3-deoxy-D-manno-octulosonic-acid transferase